ncbi:MAG: NADH-quinone oxidoreductase subunit A [Candidatus Thorarchaeota archaeon]|nr:NADH-quinone oxidoreductase subunit A [Candidatus Thorarchaeota archaeon]
MRLFIDFIPVLIWALLAAVLVIVMLLASWVLRPHVLQNSEKTSSYECGEVPIGPARIAFPYSYLTYTVLFLVVDVMGAFLWLFASASMDLRTNIAVVWQVVLFVLIILVGIGFSMRMVPETFLSGPETLQLYRTTKAAREGEEITEGGH